MSSTSLALLEIPPIDGGLDLQIRRRLDSLTKPPGSLGRLEDLALHYCRVHASLEPPDVRARVVVFAADHGVVAEGVSAYPQSVTAQMVRNMAAGGAAINVLARQACADCVVVDVGIVSPTDISTVRDLHVRRGTANLATGPAMAAEEALQAIEIGLHLVQEAAEDGVTVLGVGEMGIGNTTAAAALLAALLPSPADRMTGRGTGIDDPSLARKRRIVAAAVERTLAATQDPLGILAAVGGLEIAAMAGAFLGCGAHRIVGVVDGFISTAAAAVAIRIRPEVGDYLVFSHRSEEAGHAEALDLLGQEPILDLGLRLGEGTGAALVLPLIRSAVAILREMATFESAQVDGEARET